MTGSHAYVRESGLLAGKVQDIFIWNWENV